MSGGAGLPRPRVLHVRRLLVLAAPPTPSLADLISLGLADPPRGSPVQTQHLFRYHRAAAGPSRAAPTFQGSHHPVREAPRAPEHPAAHLPASER